MWWLEHHRSFVPIGRLYVKSGQTKPFGRLAPQNPSHISSSPIPFFHRTAPDESSGDRTSEHEVTVSSRRQLHREPPRRRAHPRVEMTGVHASRPEHIFFPYGASTTGGLALWHASPMATPSWRTDDGGSAPSLTATLSSTSTRGDGDLVRLMRVDGDERRRP
jgi:hypothetical protein